MKFNLNKAIKTYKQTGKGIEAIREEIALRVYAYPNHKNFCTEDDCADFLISFFPRINNTINNYSENGSSFDAYLQNNLKWHMKGFVVNQINKKRKEQIIYRENCDNVNPVIKDVWEIHESPSLSALTQAQKKKESREVMLLALKCADYMDDEIIDQISELTGINSAFIFHQIEYLRTTLRKRTDRIKHLEQRRSRNYFRILCWQEDKRNCEDKYILRLLDEKIFKEKRCYDYTGNILARASRTPSHNAISHVLGIPKGTIDSSYFYMRNK